MFELPPVAAFPFDPVSLHTASPVIPTERSMALAVQPSGFTRPDGSLLRNALMEADCLEAMNADSMMIRPPIPI